MSEQKKTLGIITFNRPLNYGAVLQAYAMKYVCESLGFETHIVDYWQQTDKQITRNDFKEFLRRPSKKMAFRLCRKALSYPADKNREHAFRRFRAEFLSETVPCKNADDISALSFDYYIIGSDQIWNYWITGDDFDPVYFGLFCSPHKPVIYAASANDTPFPFPKEANLRELLKKTDAFVSAREAKLADYLHTVTGEFYPTVIDPTLLAGKQCMDSLVLKKKRRDPYILIYQIDANPASDISVRNIERAFHRSVFTMTTPRIGSIHGRRGTVGPAEFLTLLKNADFLVTNSFHGVALSLLFEKQFFVYEHSGVMSRIDDLLDRTGIKARKIRMVHDIHEEQKIDYNKVKPKLEALRRESFDYLIKALEGNYKFPKSMEKAGHDVQPIRMRRKDNCSGCSACTEICPANAIQMIPDEEGFCYPLVDERYCNHCGRCDSFCGFVKDGFRQAFPSAYGVKHKDEKVRISSRSGAAFIALSDVVLENGGIIYGAAMDEMFAVSHIRADSKEQRDRMKGAKYVQSNMEGIYTKVIHDLCQGELVLFSGTPCQISGLLALLEKKKVDSKKLITCDLVCHGTPSPDIWKQYLAYIESRYRQKICKADFRDKSLGWDTHCESFILEDGKKIISRDYSDLFYKHVMLRPSCHKCYFAGIHRISDITLADFWGIESNKSSFNDNRGVSLVFVNTEKGRRLFEQAKKSVEYFECRPEKCLQPALIRPTVKSEMRDEFWKDYTSMDFANLLKKYTTPKRIKNRVKRRIKGALYKVGLRQYP